ncbi:MAG: biotin-dependent carboxyltransferase family protein [Gemmatimonadales bacterium]|nr:biotin-dependent carboxyltransferase family protein [Gemmatimonadales bacterium]
MTLHVLAPGLLTTVQDLGRPGLGALGVGPGGAADRGALRRANALVGNDDGAAALEITLRGPTLCAGAPLRAALTGAPFEATLDGAVVPRDAAFAVPAGTTLAIGGGPAGCRAYLAIAGGVDVPMVLGARATHLRGGFGGHAGRMLRAGDVLAIGPAPPPARVPASLPPAGPTGPVRCVTGEAWDMLPAAARATFTGTQWRVSPRSDRMGVRLEGPSLLDAPLAERRSEGVLAGTVQLPPDGRPIVLLADHPTTGGYPVLAHVIGADLGALAQWRPGDAVGFTLVPLDEAVRLTVDAERALAAHLHRIRHGDA